ncbi:sulfatase [Candidatus Fermentibacteria bacterium]|nr:sulfatase [Candidatus Fermentibacteria bacterium]
MGIEDSGNRHRLPLWMKHLIPTARILVMAAGLIAACAPDHGPGVISLLDTSTEADFSVPWRTILLEKTPKSLFRAADGIIIRGGTAVQEADTSGLGFLLPPAPEGTMEVRLAYAARWTGNDTLSIMLVRGNTVVDYKAIRLRGATPSVRLYYPGGSGIMLRVVHRMARGAVLPLKAVAAGITDAVHQKDTMVRMSSWLNWLIIQKDAVDLRRGLPPGRRLPLSIDGCTRVSVVLHAGDSLSVAMPARGRMHWALQFAATGLQPGCDLEVMGLMPNGWETLRGEGIATLHRWTVEAISLEAGSAQPESLRFHARGLRGMIAVGDPVLVPTTPSRRMNLLVLLLDTLRSDRLGCYGYQLRPTSARLDSIVAAKGFTVCDRARAAAPYTLPSIMKIMTSRFLHKNLSPSGASLLRTPPMLAELLRAEGYYCVAHTGGGVLRHAGFERGFHEYHWSQSFGKSCDVFPPAMKWLQRRHEPFFLFVHTYETHLPYFTGSFDQGLDRGSLPVPGGDRGLLRAHIDSVEIADAESLYLQALYDSHVRIVCDAVADLFARMDELNLWETTAVMILSDHGEEFGEHLGLYAQHGQTLYSELTDIPFIFRVPGLEGPSHVATEVSAVDLLPTAVDVLGLEWRGEVDGVSLRPLLEKRPLDRPTPVIANLSNPPVLWEAVALFGDTLKYIEVTHRARPRRPGLFPSVTYPAGVEVYDALTDPGEFSNLSGRRPYLARVMGDSLQRVLGRVLPPLVADDSTPAAHVSEGLSRQLEALGYFQ